MRVMHKYRFQRHRADGTHNESVSLPAFVKWHKEFEEGDEFFVGRTEWVQVEKTGRTKAGDPVVAKIDDAVLVSSADAKKIPKPKKEPTQK